MFNHALDIVLVDPECPLDKGIWSPVRTNRFCAPEG
jgi:hypothetical protein